jgi:predicted nucleic acid-binding protein
VIVVDTGAVIALVDADDRQHGTLLQLFQASGDRWVYPWAILPEVDYLLATRVGRRAQAAFLADLASGAFRVAWGEDDDLVRARELESRHAKLGLGLVDGAVIAVAERLKASAIATLDLRHFGPVRIKGDLKLLPRDR